MKKAYLTALLALIAILLFGCASPSVHGAPSPTSAPALETPAPEPAASEAPMPSAPESDATLSDAPSDEASPDEAEFDEANAMHMLLINTGKSDALLFVLPDGTAFMVDTGLKDTYDAVDAALARMGVDALDAVIITHAHSDHIGGLKKLLKAHPVAAIYENPLDTATYSDKEREKLDKYATDYGLDVIGVSGGDSFALGSAKIDVLSPYLPYSDDMDDNNNSLVLRVTYGSTRYLLMGDATYLIEQKLITSGVDPAADVLKVGRHGKLDASVAEFLAAVSPKLAAVTGNSADDPESPSPTVLSRLAELGAEYYVNEGAHMAVDFMSDGKTVRAEVIYPD